MAVVPSFPLMLPHFFVEFGMAVRIILSWLRPVRNFVIYSSIATECPSNEHYTE